MAFLGSARFAMTASALALCAAGCASRAPAPDSAASAKARASAVRTAPERPADLLAEAPGDAIVSIHRSKCGSCHTRVEPGSVPRATAESAMQRHRRRAKLTEREWEDMVDFLSIDGAHARPTAVVR
jgi:cytochrome c5